VPDLNTVGSSPYGPAVQTLSWAILGPKEQDVVFSTNVRLVSVAGMR